jgi:hypothetical protein
MRYFMGNRFWVVIGLSLATCCGVFAQQPVFTALETAQYWEKEGNAQSAAYFYKEHIASHAQVELVIYYRCAMLMKDIFHYNDAAYYFGKIVDSDSLATYPAALFWLGMVQKNNGNYEQAQEFFIRYQNEFASHGDSVLSKRVAVELSAYTLISALQTDTVPVKIEKLSPPVNSEYSEFNAIQVQEEALYFSSTRPISQVDYTRVLEDFYMTKIFVAPYRVNGIASITALPSLINNPKYNNANFCFNGDKSKLYFTRCPIVAKGHACCAIWVSERKEEKWSRPKKLTKRINQPNSNTTHPYFVEDEDKQVLFFVSDRQDGFGGKDIWTSVVAGDDFEEPVNVGEAINTSGDEITPYYDLRTQTLYFSSDWHGGLGGFDIFKSKKDSNTWGEPINMGYPFNSSANDLYFIINEVDRDGFLTSNRKGSYFATEETCCNDIYEYRWIGDEIVIHRDTFYVEKRDSLVESIQDILPLSLYFHNDEPNPRSKDITTDKDYKTTLEEYYTMKDRYKKEYAFGLQGEEKEKAIAAIDSFFVATVGKGFAQLERFSAWLLADLQRGNNVTITIIGFASPLHSDDYNTNLSLRRIMSLKNHIRNQAVFNPYLDSALVGNKLRFMEDPRGKRFASQYVSGNPNDIRNSVYSIAAALERRIQIVLYKSEKEVEIQHPDLLVAKDTIIVSARAGVNQYELYVEIENAGDRVLEADTVFSDNQFVKATFSQQVLQPAEKAWIRITFSSDMLKNKAPTKIIIRSNANEREVIIKG